MNKTLKVVQVLPELNSGGVERGTIEFAKTLVAQGHESIVISNGGRQVQRLEREGSRHIEMPVHKKSPVSLLQVRAMRELLKELQPDIIHVRSRVPAWIVWLAWRKLPEHSRPKLVSTFHGMYSVNAYSAIMARAEQVIAISDCVYSYILDNYQIEPSKITRIYRGLDRSAFSDISIPEGWCDELYNAQPELRGKKLILMPGRLTRWKGQEAFLDMMALLAAKDATYHGVIVGEADPNKAHYEDELRQICQSKGLTEHVSFLGHRSDIQYFYKLADVTCHMSNKSEPFGRTVPEALATGCMVVAYNRGGASESLNAAFPRGLVEADNIQAFADRIFELTTMDSPPEISLPEEFYLEHQSQETLKVYRKALQS
ncbi:glycosyltransferase family 4 protein [Litoribrevibacter albus]|uniref:Glycosyl transferase n=1 Tax=Litoribrevibacter albus TaxID=1473156 RepID=A0AA37SDL6_9GAMM|nr:glycosyltransferase family 4 protein [Litoribrevibacter albus]GLQ32508.1 glycosyl transferase [Litoribrevibacter albus]